MSTLDKYIKELSALKVHAQGVAIRCPSGELRSLTDGELRQLGVTPNKDFSFLLGQEFDIPGTSFKLCL